ncbi:hypothetical protein [Paenibacillus herberti]|uniref:Uncharacterized protein n=1 Tax=Paenibacillus herberti TaxID=1619309 RepID=A0A229P502_9BACL|nr:hypothetical protein [Paenibacillus herberti]OXM17137.1 hypothetical protein CGZ75_11085 [Paenibacillus herberti]
MHDLLERLKEGEDVDAPEIPDLSKLILREQVWAKLDHPSMFVHFGYDYYMYIGLKGENSDYVAFEQKINYLGLFAERVKSPYS